MKKLLALSALALLLAGCGNNDTLEDDNDLMDMMGDESNSGETDSTVDPVEQPYSEGPSEIPSDLIPNDQD